ncbi:MAG: hypothetical protein JW880_02915 [Candidatus Thermoplasmatota archaeon]|nr:hypothetical protein [Candidatus Thermoplasmatota archaeon]
MIVSRVPSGLPGLDSFIQGGIPVNSTIALRAEPSNPTECFQQQFIVEGLRMGAPAIYCCTNRPVGNVIRSLQHQGFDVTRHVMSDQLVFLDCYSVAKETFAIGIDQAIQKKILHVEQMDEEGMLQEGLAEAVDRLSTLKGLRSVCESVPATLKGSSAVDVMRWGRKAFGELRAFDTVTLHTFPIGVRDELFSLMVEDFDAVIDISIDRNADRMKYYLSIQKMRLTEVPVKTFELETEGNILTLKTVQKIT